MPEPVGRSVANPHGVRSAASFFNEFFELESSVPDLASTLTTQAEQEAEDANVSFLRGALLDEGHENAADPDAITTDVEDRRLRYLDAASARGGQEVLAEQEDHHTRREESPADYRGWAPESVEEYEATLNEATAPLSREESALRRESQDLRERMRNRLRRDYFYDRVAELSARIQEPGRTPTAPASPSSSSQGFDNGATPESSLRTTALLQAVRRNTQFSPHSRNRLQGYILDRQRAQDEAADGRRASSPGLTRQPEGTPRDPRVEALERPQRELLAIQERIRATQGRMLAFQERQEREDREERNARLLAERNVNYHGRPPVIDAGHAEERRRRRETAASSRPSKEGRSIDATIKYLGRLRFCESDSEGLETAEEVGFHCSERIRSDFLRETTLVPPPPESSWLKVGGVLSGSQSAVTPSVPNATSSAQQTYVPSMPPSQNRSRVRHPTFGTTTARTPSPVQPSTRPLADSLREISTFRPTISSGTTNPSNARTTSQSNDEHWRVKVTIQAIDYSTMSLAGTMEAFNVPDKSVPNRESSITTYLEGEIIDFNTYALETKSFKADTRIDATYWRRLPPFRDLQDEETVIRCLTSERWLREELMEKWILMRWKEKCFVPPSDAQSSLTISGFYYVSLRRSDGAVEGLYYDPNSTPYQHLVLRPEMRTFPSYAFQ